MIDYGHAKWKTMESITSKADEVIEMIDNLETAMDKKYAAYIGDDANKMRDLLDKIKDEANNLETLIDKQLNDVSGSYKEDIKKLEAEKKSLEDGSLIFMMETLKEKGIKEFKVCL